MKTFYRVTPFTEATSWWQNVDGKPSASFCLGDLYILADPDTIAITGLARIFEGWAKMIRDRDVQVAERKEIKSGQEA
jgi:hypothetical protein